jgi:hypothetical protein
MVSESEPARPATARSVHARARLERRQARRALALRRRRRVLIAGVLFLLVVPYAFSYVTTMLQPSSVPLGIRSVEWARTHGFVWFVNTAERKWYSWNAPAKGGPSLTRLPQVGRVARALPAVRPARVRPPITPHLPGEGVWHAAGTGGGNVLVTTFRTDPAYPRLVAYAAWIDHRRTQLALYPGRYEPPSAPVRGPMQVPYGERWRLLATFNSGFTHRDGQGGFAINGVSYEPMRTGDATLLAYRDGSVDVKTWTGGPAPGADVVLARQNLPLIVAGGRRTPNLQDGRAWGATLGNAIRVWRSGVGIDKHGNLIYVAADFQTVTSLADILIRAGAVRGMQLDINAEWPTFNVYGRSGGRDGIKIVPNSQQTANRYLSADDRDFFAVLRRSGAPTKVGFR